MVGVGSDIPRTERMTIDYTIPAPWRADLTCLYPTLGSKRLSPTSNPIICTVQAESEVWIHPVTFVIERNKSKLVIHKYNFIHFPKIRFLRGSYKLLNVKTHLGTSYFKGLDKRRRTVETRAFYFNLVQNGSVKK